MSCAHNDPVLALAWQISSTTPCMRVQQAAQTSDLLKPYTHVALPFCCTHVHCLRAACPIHEDQAWRESTGPSDQDILDPTERRVRYRARCEVQDDAVWG